MHIRHLVMLVLLLAGLGAGVNAQSFLSTAPPAASTSPVVGRAVPAPTPWPNLDKLTNFSNPGGTTCDLNGAAAPGTEKAKLVERLAFVIFWRSYLH